MESLQRINFLRILARHARCPRMGIRVAKDNIFMSRIVRETIGRHNQIAETFSPTTDSRSKSPGSLLNLGLSHGSAPQSKSLLIVVEASDTTARGWRRIGDGEKATLAPCGGVESRRPRLRPTGRWHIIMRSIRLMDSRCQSPYHH